MGTASKATVIARRAGRVISARSSSHAPTTATTVASVSKVNATAEAGSEVLRARSRCVQITALGTGSVSEAKREALAPLCSASVMTVIPDSTAP